MNYPYTGKALCLTGINRRILETLLAPRFNGEATHRYKSCDDERPRGVYGSVRVDTSGMNRHNRRA